MSRRPFCLLHVLRRSLYGDTQRTALNRPLGIVGLLCCILLLSCGRGAAAPVKETPAGDGKHDLYGDPLPKGAIMRLGTVRLRHHSPLTCVAISPDGRWAASTGRGYSDPWTSDNPIRIWNLNTGKEISRLVGHTSKSLEVVFSPGSKMIASLGVHSPDNSVRLWDVATGKLIYDLGSHSNAARRGETRRAGLAFSHDGRFLASSGPDHVIRIWEVSAGTKVREWMDPSGYNSLAFSPDGSELASARLTIQLWDVQTGKLRTSFRSATNSVQSLCYSADGTCLVCQTENRKPRERTIEWWDRKTGSQIKEFPGTLLGFSTNGRTAAIFRAKEVQMWDLLTKKQTSSFPADKRFAFGGRFGYWGGLSANGSRLVTADLTSIRALRTSDGKDLRTVTGHGSTVYGLSFLNTETLVSAGDNTIRWWDLRTGSELDSKGGQHGRIQSAAFTLDGKTLAVGHGGGKVMVWDVGGRKDVFSYDLEPPSAPIVSFSLDGSKLAIQSRLTGNKLPFRLIDTQRWKEILRFNFGNGGRGLAFLPGNKLVFYLDVSSADLRDLNEGKHQELPDLARLGNQPTLAQSADGRFLVLGHIGGKESGVLRLWETASKKTVWMASLGKTDPTALAISPDNTTLAIGGRDGALGLWDARSGRELDRFTGHQGEVRALAFSRDGKRLASGSADTTIHIWDIAKTMTRPRPPSVRLKDEEIRDLWTCLGSDDAPAAQRAVWRLVDAGDQTRAFLAKELFIDEDGDKRFQRLVKQLDDTSVKTRERAMQELIILGASYTNAAKQALAKAVAPRVKQRLEGILAAYERGAEQRLRHRQVRVLQILESLGTTTSKDLLKQIIEKYPSTPFAIDAKATLRRLE
jgi:WD40 repeat protein